MCHFEQEDLIVKQLPAFVLPEIQRYAKDDGILDSAQTPVFPRLDALGHAALRISILLPNSEHLTLQQWSPGHLLP